MLRIAKADEQGKEAEMIDLTDIRYGDRTWHEELDWLRAKGYRPGHNALDALAARNFSCGRCGDREVDYHGYSIAGIVLRSYAVCHTCGHFIEF